MESLTNMNDTYVKAYIEGVNAQTTGQSQHMLVYQAWTCVSPWIAHELNHSNRFITCPDIHWRAKKGKASWNWRMKFDVTLGHNTRTMKFPYLNISMWDKDILKYDDLIAGIQFP